MKCLRLLATWLCFIALSFHHLPGFGADIEIKVSALFKGSALLEISGKQQLLKTGSTSPEGVTVIAADSKKVIVSYQGVEKELNLSRQIGALFMSPSKAEVQLLSGAGGLINGRQVRMLVDTGATSVAMSERQASLLGIRYQQGVAAVVNTAGGNVNAWHVNLDSVGVGSVVVNQFAAAVLEGDFPEVILLGKSFLDKVDLDREQGVRLIRSRF